MRALILIRFLLFFLLICTVKISAQVFDDIIRPLTLSSDTSNTFLLDDLYSTDSDIEFEENTDILIDYSSEDHMLTLTPARGFEGLALIKFKDGFDEKSIPVIINSKQVQSFSYRPPGNPLKVNLFGSFNSWNRAQYPMTDPDKDGTYEISIPIEAGRYEYKFFVDGKEYFDPVNPEKISNGMGDFNSLVTVPPKYPGDFSLHIVSHEEKNDNYTITFYLDNDEREIAFTKQNICCLIDNTVLNDEYITVERNRYMVSIPDDLLNDNKTFRTVVTQGGRVSNWQTVKFINGEPAGRESMLWDDAVIYNLMIDRFNDGDKSNSIPVQHPELSTKANYQGGDFQGIIDKLEEGYFDSLGINTIWISPVVDNTDIAFKEYPEPHRWYSGYHGYWPIDAERVEEKFGDMQLLKKLIKTAKKKDIRVLLDYVAHHVHIEHPLWKEHPDWFGTLDLPDGRKNLRIWDEFRLTTWFEPYLPSFDFVKSKDALDYMTDNAVWWLQETGAAGFRHDAVKHVPNTFWRDLTRKIREQIEQPEKKMVYQVGETFGSYELVSSYVNNGQLDAQFNFILYDTAVPTFSDSTIPFRFLDEQLKKTFTVYGDNHLMGNVMDSHDKVRFMAYADGDVTSGTNQVEIGWSNPPIVDNASSYKKLQLYIAYMLSVPGLPVIYYGDEIGMSGAADPDNRRMMRFGKDITGAEKDNLKEVSRIIKLRREHPALRYGDFHSLVVEKDVYAYMRSDLNERVLVILNKSNAPVDINLKLPDYLTFSRLVSLDEGGVVKTAGNKAVVHLEALSSGFYKVE